MAANSESALNEARNLLQQKSVDELNKLLNSEEEIAKFISSLSEVGFIICKRKQTRIIMILFLFRHFIRFNKWKLLEKV